MYDARIAIFCSETAFKFRNFGTVRYTFQVRIYKKLFLRRDQEHSGKKIKHFDLPKI